ncbi:MAG TPA: copper resistance protein CopC [Gemmatimonadaceae bacterium]|nr:copper resistance protein CopC [Gemmatimonadaceae bacterium]
MSTIVNRRAVYRAAIIASALTIAAVSARAAVLFHAALLRSSPTADAKLKRAPADIRLVFSEEVVPALSRIALIEPAGDSIKLKVSNDPHDVHTLIGAVPLSSMDGKYSVYWRVVSADGHLVDGTFSFSVNGPAAATSTVTTPLNGGDSPKAAPTIPPAAEKTPVVASLLRGLGLAALMAAVGILFFGVTTHDVNAVLPARLLATLTNVGAVLLVFHFFVWLSRVSPDNASYGVVLQSKLGRIELARTMLAVLTSLAVTPLRKYKAALAFGVASLLVSGAVGHSAAIDPIVAVPSKSLHLVGGALWLGGLIWLITTARLNAVTHHDEAKRVSFVALISVIAVVASGLLQTVLFLNSPGDLLNSGYGKLVVAKIIGLLILIGYGAYHRYSLLPRLNERASALSASVRQEIAVMTIVILIGGFLAYVPPPPAASSGTTVTRGIQ